MAIPNGSTDTKVTSTLTGKRGKFSVHEHAHEKIMGVLTNLYEDPELAAVREYLTNALDAQIEAQEKDPNYVWRPIEVTTPSHWNKTYRIRDFGVGMSVEDIEKVYSQYGYSTKEHTNDQTGMLGLGSKCGLTYTGQFTVIGWKNGVKTTALITLNEDEVPEYVILDTAASDEPNGLEISIPVRDRNSFAEKTRDFLRWWKDGQVLVDGAEPTKHAFKEVKPGVFLIEKTGYSFGVPISYVIMGNVPYVVDAEYVDAALRDANLGFAAYVEMGAVDFPPNRERLRYNTRTKDKIKAISAGLFDAILTEKLNEITNAATHREAWIAHAGLSYHFAQHPKAKGLTYKGQKFDERIQHNHMTLDWDWQGHGQISERQWLTLSNPIHRGALIVTGVTQGTKPTSYFKKKVNHYIEENGLDVTEAILVDKDIDSVWLTHCPRIDADTIKNIKLPKNPSANSGPRAAATYEFYTVDAAGTVTVDDQSVIPVPTGVTLAYISPQDMRETYRKSGCSGSDLAYRLGENYILVVLAKNRFEKFLRSYPNAITAAKAVQQRIDFLVASTTDAEYAVDTLDYGEREFLRAVDVTKIDDPELVALAKIVQDKKGNNGYNRATDLENFARRASIYNVKVPDKKSVKSIKVSKRYPLVNHVGRREMKHMLIYVNAVYAAEHAPQP